MCFVGVVTTDQCQNSLHMKFSVVYVMKTKIDFFKSSFFEHCMYTYSFFQSNEKIYMQSQGSKG